MSLDDPAADRQPDTHTAGFGCVEGIEQPLKILRIHTGAGILHAQTHTIDSFSPGSDQQLPRAVVNTNHGVGSIAEQVQGDLLQLDTIADDRREVLGVPTPESPDSSEDRSTITQSPLAWPRSDPATPA
jgi:hypothetical protein